MTAIEEIQAGSQEPNSAIAGLRALAKILGLREDFLIDLILDPDDWSFIVKSHALLESVTCTLLAMHLRKNELEAVLAEEVEMKGRIEMTKALGITTSEDRKVMLGATCLALRIRDRKSDIRCVRVRSEDLGVRGARIFKNPNGHGDGSPAKRSYNCRSRARR